MKTKEFIKRIEELGYSYTIENRFIIVDGEKLKSIAIISLHSMNNALIRTDDDELGKVCFEYAQTPLEEREEDELADEESIRIESFYNHIGERRYRIIRLETGEVHDGNGYGYKSVDSALKAYSYIRKYLS